MLFKGWLARLAECRSKTAAGKRCRVRAVTPRRSFRPDLEYLEDRVTPSLLVNGDFETANFTGWTQSGVLNFTSVNSNNTHGGSFSAELGPDTGEGFLAQTFTTTPGNPYTLNYWLQHNGGTPSEFHAMIDGTDLPGSVLSDPVPAFGYTQYTFTFTATNPSTELKFGFQEAPSYFHLDDVSVDAGTYVVPTVVRTNLTGTFKAPVSISTDHLVFNTPINPATFTFSTPNDQYAITDPSLATTNATTITATDATNTQFDVTFPAQTSLGAYTLTVGPNIMDPVGNPMAAAFTSTFTIALLANGGFETGDFTGWTQSGDTSDTFVSSGSPHTGTYAADLGPFATGGDGFLAQSFASTPGSHYTLDYWLANDGGTPNSFHAMIDGVDIPLSVLTDAAAMPYTEFTFDILATLPTTELKFGFIQVPNYWHLDDVSVVPAGPAPGPHAHGGGSGGNAVFVAPAEALAAQAGLVGSLGWTLSPSTPVAVQASGQMEHAILADHIFSGLGTKDARATLTVRPLSSGTEVDPFSLGRLDEGLWSL
jgi:hypothetical protein